MRRLLAWVALVTACGQAPAAPVSVSPATSPVQCTLAERDECCVDNDCTAQAGGACVRTPIFYCGGVQPEESTECMYDGCSSDADCASNEVCLTRGAFGEPVSRCAPTFCRTDAECTAGTAGRCTPFVDPCSGRFRASVCTYEESECRTSADCPAQHGRAECIAYGETTRCIDYSPPP